MTQLCLVPPAMAAQAWPLAREHIRKAGERSRVTDYDKVEREVLGGIRQLWLVLTDGAVVGAAVTRLVADGACEITALGTEPGAAKDHLNLIDRIEDFARAEGCGVVRIIGRQGWQRVLPGYAPKAVILEKTLNV